MHRAQFSRRLAQTAAAIARGQDAATARVRCALQLSATTGELAPALHELDRERALVREFGALAARAWQARGAALALPLAAAIPVALEDELLRLGADASDLCARVGVAGVVAAA